ncbi:S-type pyocin domain-containing protein [Pseudomonas sp. UBA6562]|uniref:S-type pyocin domain-containing protein n=1 Tax=Pseudomonas sp. UBA6562 TaxID=1947332 RepID=UPI0025CF3D5D|nr:S-type pyocin domain-containing protein [Pseudomonas sp. UBA6562]
MITTATDNLDATIESELQILRQRILPDNDSATAQRAAELARHHTLISEKTTELNRQTELALRFFPGEDPIDKSADAIVSRLYRPRQEPVRAEDVLHEWNISYTAAYEARLLRMTIERLAQRLPALEAALAEAKAMEPPPAPAPAPEPRIDQPAEPQPEPTPEQPSAPQPEPTPQQPHEPQTEPEPGPHLEPTPEQPREPQTGLEPGPQPEPTPEQPREPQTGPEPGPQPDPTPEQPNGPQTGPEPEPEPGIDDHLLGESIYRSQGAHALSGAAIITVEGILTSAALQTAVRSAIGSAISVLAGVGQGVLVGVSALAYSPKLGNGELPERHHLQMPLSDLAPNPSVDLLANAQNTTLVDLPYRLHSTSKTLDQTELLVLRSDGQSLPAGVRVLRAEFNAALNAYGVTTPGTSGRTLLWTPVVTPGDSSTTLPGEQGQSPIYEGAPPTPQEGRIDEFPGLADASLDDYIIIFPADAGLPPLYIVFNDRRKEPGILMGQGMPDRPIWLAPASTAEGAAIPPRIADKLRGMKASNWDKARNLIWSAIAEDPILAPQFKLANQRLLLKGNAPFVIPTEQVGERMVFEIHHIVPISKGGAVYDIDNLRIMTPRQHVKIHSKKKAR